MFFGQLICAFVISCKLFALFVDYNRATFTAAVAVEHGQMTTLSTVIQLILENLLVFRESTLFQNLFQYWKSSL